MTDTPTSPTPAEHQPHQRRRKVLSFLLVVLVSAAASAAVLALLVNIVTRKQEAKDPYLKLVRVDEDTTDSAVWGMNFRREWDGYRRTVEPSKTNFGGGDATPASDKLARNPWLKRMFEGYAFSIEYRDRRGHYYTLEDQEKTLRVKKANQPGACLNCHTAVMPLYRFAGRETLGQDASRDQIEQKGFEQVCAMSYQKAHDLVDAKGKKLVVHPMGCVDCHDPDNMELRVTRPAFKTAIAALKTRQGVKDYDVNRDATRQEMRSYVCAQCHVEYYFKGEGKLLTFPWANGLKVEEIEEYYDNLAVAAPKGLDGGDKGFIDWKHAQSHAPLLKAQHPEFETWNQGVHSRSGVACADCHMPYVRQGAMKVSDHWVRSPLLHVNESCQVCHHYPEEELKARVAVIQGRNLELMNKAAAALTDMLDAIAAARQAGVSDAQLRDVLMLHRKGQWRLDFVAAENSMGFHAPQEAARILGEAADYFRQAQLKTAALSPAAAALGAKAGNGTTSAPAGDR